MSIWSDPSADPFPRGEPTSQRPPLVCKPSPRHPISSIRRGLGLTASSSYSAAHPRWAALTAAAKAPTPSSSVSR
jgi:hypothetical protein